jgi:formamidopyrimidine-DNA glycosylase
VPELPEVETVRRGLAEFATDRQVTQVMFGHPRAVRRQPGGRRELRAGVVGRRLGRAARRGKYLWLPLVEADGTPSGEALVAHLGMSGQFRVRDAGDPSRPSHPGVGFALSDGSTLWFCDQRTFGWILVEQLVPARTGPAEVEVSSDQPDDREPLVPVSARQVGLDPFDARYDLPDAVRRLRARRTELKRALLDQTLVSGIGNIYADEALWRARLHGRRRTDRLTAAQARSVLEAAAAVMTASLAAGGTSFDPLYVDVNGDSGWFDRSLNAYGQEGEPCPRCGTPIRREAFTNRSSFFCPRCQPPPRRR